MADNSSQPQVVFSGGEKNRPLVDVKKLHNDAVLSEAFDLLKILAKSFFSDGNFAETIPFEVTIVPKGEDASLISQTETAKLNTKRFNADHSVEEQNKYAYTSDVVRFLGGIKRVIAITQGENANYNDTSLLETLNVLNHNIVDELELESLGEQIVEIIVDLIVSYFLLYPPHQRPQSPEAIIQIISNSDIARTHAETIYQRITPDDDEDIVVPPDAQVEPTPQVVSTAGVPRFGGASDDQVSTPSGESPESPSPEELSTLYGQQRNKAYFAKQRRVQNEAAWLYNRALYELFYDVGVDGSAIPADLQQQLFNSIREYTLTLDDAKLDKLFASPSARQRTLIALFAELQRSGFKTQLDQFYNSYKNELPTEQISDFERSLETSVTIFSGTVLTLDQKLELQLSSTLGSSLMKQPLILVEIQQRVDDLIELYGAKINTVTFDGQELNLNNVKSGDDIEAFLNNFLTPEEIRDVFQLPNEFQLDGVNFSKLKRIIINYARQRAAVLLVEQQNLEILEGTIKLSDSFSNLKGKPDEKTRHVNYLIIAAEERKELGSEKSLAPYAAKGDKKYQKILKLYKPFIPVWNGLSTEEQIAVYKQFNYPTRQFELLNDPAQKLPFIIEFITFDVTRLAHLRLRGRTRGQSIYDAKDKELLAYGVNRREHIGKELLYLHTLKDLSLTELDTALSNNTDYQDYTESQKAVLLDRIIELRQFTKDEIESTLLLQKKLAGDEPADLQVSETRHLIAQFHHIKNISIVQQNKYQEIIEDEGRSKEELVTNYGKINQEALQESVDTFYAITQPDNPEAVESLPQPRVYYFTSSDNSENNVTSNLTFIPQQILLEQPPVMVVDPMYNYYPPAELDQNNPDVFHPDQQSFSLQRVKNFFAQNLREDIGEPDEGGLIKKYVKKRLFPNGTDDHANDSWFRSKLKGTVGQKIKDKYGDKLQALISKGGLWGMAARMLIDSKYRKKKLLQIFGTLAGGGSLLWGMMKSGLASLFGGLTGAAGGAYLGVSVGSLILPGVGTVIGGVIGAGAGALGGASLGQYLQNWSSPTQTPSLSFQSSSFIPQGDFAPQAASNGFAKTPPTTSQAARVTSRINRIPGEGSSVAETAVRPEFAQAQANQAAANQAALAQQAAAQQAAAQAAVQAAAQQAATVTATTGITSILTSYGLLIPGGSLAVIMLISLYNLMVINSAFLIPVPPDIGVSGNDYCGTGNASVGCFDIDTIGGESIDYDNSGVLRTTVGITAIEKQNLEEAFARNAGKYSTYINLLCSKGPIKIKKIDTPDPNKFVGYSPNPNTIIALPGFFNTIDDIEIVLTHETGHIILQRNGSTGATGSTGGTIGIIDDFLNVWSGSVYTYSYPISDSQRSIEAFSEGIMNFLIPSYKKARPGLPTGVNDYYPTVRDYPDEYQWFAENVFGGQGGVSCGGPVTGNVGNTGDIYIAVGDNSIDNVVTTENSEINDTQSPFNSIKPCRWREVKGVDVSINANFFNAGNIPLGPSGESPVKYYANQTHVNTPDYMVKNMDVYGFADGDRRGSIFDIEKNWQDQKKPFVMNDYRKAVTGLVEETSNSTDQRRKVALGVSSNREQLYLGVIIEGNYSELREAMQNNGADTIIFLDGGNSAAFCPSPGSSFTSGDAVPTLEANRTVPINIGMKEVDSFIKISGTASP